MLFGSICLSPQIVIPVLVTGFANTGSWLQNRVKMSNTALYIVIEAVGARTIWDSEVGLIAAEHANLEIYCSAVVLGQVLAFRNGVLLELANGVQTRTICSQTLETQPPQLEICHTTAQRCQTVRDLMSREQGKLNKGFLF